MGVLYVVATPIGNLDDITIRAIDTLLSVPVIACEDTRHTGQMLKILKDRYAETPNETRFISVRDWNEKDTINDLIVALSNGDVALVSDAGTPLISDPGYKVVKTMRAAGFTIVPIPGPSAVTTALSVSGLPTNTFVFWGFWKAEFDLLKGATNVFFESPVRLHKTIHILNERYPEAHIVIANELTKIHEAIFDISDGSHDLQNIKGEVTVLVYL